MSLNQLLATQSYEGSWSGSLVATSDANTTLTNSATVAERGTQSLQIARTAASANRYHSFTISQTPDGVVVWRTRVYIPTATFTGAADWSPDLVALDLANGQTVRVGVRKVGSVWSWVSDQATLSGSVAFTADGWHVVALESAYIAGVNTVIRVWIDGQQLAVFTASAASKPATGRYGIINRTGGSGGSGTVYFDRTESFLVPYPTFQAAGAANSAAAATGATAPNLDLSAPTFAAPGAGDTKRMVAVLLVRPDTQSFVAPSGWTLAPGTAIETTRGKLQLAYQTSPTVAADSGVVTRFTAAGASTVAGQILLFDDVDEDSPVDSSAANQAGGTASTSATTGSVNAAAEKELLVAAAAINANSTFTPPTGFTEQSDFTTGGSKPASLGVATGVQAAAGTVAAKTFTIANSNVWWTQISTLRGEAVVAGEGLGEGPHGTFDPTTVGGNPTGSAPAAPVFTTQPPSTLATDASGYPPTFVWS